jgi:sugar/nucleoside kinase (ribokinase family)
VLIQACFRALINIPGVRRLDGIDLLVVGDANPDVVLTGAPRRPAFGQREQLVTAGSLVLGGSAAILACGAARLGLRVAFVGRVGDDAAGRFALATLADRGVDTGGCVVDPALPTAITVVLVHDDDRAILTSPGCLESLAADDVDLDLVARSRHLHVSSLFLQPRLAEGLAELFRAARAAGTGTSLDPNDDPSGRWGGGLHEVLAVTDVLLPNEREALAIAGRLDGNLAAAARDLAARGPLPVIKCGAQGALAYAGGEPVRAAGPVVTVADTVGAGDSFDAGFLAGRLTGRDLRESLALAAACGSLSTRASGGTDAQPSMAEALAAITATP